jgi:AraC family transcriptional regulator of adaptative response / DNA-3-methyladenine glycosylase II
VRRLFDLDAEPTVIDEHLAQGGLGALVRARPGLRLPGAFDGFESVLSALVGDARPLIIEAFGERVITNDVSLTYLAPTAADIAEADVSELIRLGLDEGRAHALVDVARLLTTGSIRLEPGSDVDTTYASLRDTGIPEPLITAIVTRALQWPDAFQATDELLQQATGVTNAEQLTQRAESWRPWRAYAAAHLDRGRAGLTSLAS